MRHRYAIFALIAPLSFYLACEAGNGGSNGSSGSNNTTLSGGGAGGNGTGGVNNGGGGTGGSTTTFNPVTTDSSSSGMDCDAMPNEDKDMDGFTINDGDCNDCDPNVNPNAIEVIGGGTSGSGGGGVGGNGTGGGMYEPADEDCDGMEDNIAPLCDGSLAVGSTDAMDAARAVDICKLSTGVNDWGIVDAKWISSDGSPAPTSANFHLGHGIIPTFGPNVNAQNGGAMLALSSGTARPYGHPEYQSVGGFNKGFTSSHPSGFPKESPSCPGTTTGTPNDVAAVEITLRAPSNAFGFRFDFDFYTYEWPQYVCSQFNDFFVAELIPYPAGQTDGNISFDQLNNPVSVNNAFVEVCGCTGGAPCMAGGKSFSCALGDSELMGTGFGPDTESAWHAATSWLLTQAPIEPNAEFQIRWMTYDSGDGSLDSTTLIDNFQWIAEPGTTVGTEPIPDPK